MFYLNLTSEETEKYLTFTDQNKLFESTQSYKLYDSK